MIAHAQTTARRWTASNILSASRLLLALPAALLTLANLRVEAAIVCLIAAVTDVLDGYLARRNREITEFGKIIDPLADKVFVAVMVVVLLSMGLVPLWLVAVVIGRDTAILVGGLIVERRTGRVLPSNYPGKAAVVSLSIALLLILLGVRGIAVDLFTWLALTLLTISLFLYGARAVKVLQEETAGPASHRQ